MFRLVRLAFGTLGAILRSRPALVAENLALRHQLGVLLRSKPAQLHLTSWDRALWAFVLQRSSSWRPRLVIVRPATPGRGPTAHSGDGIRQPDLGCAPNPRRTP